MERGPSGEDRLPLSVTVVADIDNCDAMALRCDIAKASRFIHMSLIPDTNYLETQHDDRHDLTAGHFCARRHR